MKKIINIIVLIVVILLMFSIIISLLVFKKDKYEILTKKFYIPITEQYEILYFENVNGNPSVRHCRAEIKVTEEEFDSIISQLNNSNYNAFPPEDYNSYLQKNKWISNKKIDLVYLGFVVEYRFPIFSDRITMQIFITGAEDGYRHIYLSRN